METPAAQRIRGPRARAGRAVKLGLTTAERALDKFFQDQAPQYAAAISYYALFSLFPLAILIVAGFGTVVDDAAARSRVIDLVLDNLPLREDAGRRELERVLRSVTDETRGFGLFGAIGLVVAASAVMGAIRNALNRVWGADSRRPPAQGKLLDVILVVGLGLLVALSLALTAISRITVEVADDLREALGTVGSAVPRLLLELGEVLPLAVAFAAALILFRYVPATSTRLRDVWPGAAIAALGFEAAKVGFAIYLENFADYGAVYASLAAVVAFLVFVFLTANLLLVGAEVAFAWPRVRDEPERPDEDGEPFVARLRGALAGLFVRRRK